MNEPIKKKEMKKRYKVDYKRKNNLVKKIIIATQ